MIVVRPIGSEPGRYSELDSLLASIEHDLGMTIVGDDEPQGLVRRVLRAVDRWVKARQQWAENWRRENDPDYKPDETPPVPSEVLRKVAPRLSEAIAQAKGLPELAEAAKDDLSKAGMKVALSMAAEVLPWLALLIIVTQMKGR